MDGKEIYNIIRRKIKDVFYKNIVKKGYFLKKGKCKFLRLKINFSILLLIFFGCVVNIGYKVCR